MEQDLNLARCVIRKRRRLYISCANVAQRSASQLEHTTLCVCMDTGKGEVVATRDEDFINFTLVESLWEYRKVVLNSRNSCLDLTEGDPPARRSHPIDGGGVEAHGSNATLSS